MKKPNSLRRKAIMSTLAISLGAASSALANDSELKNTLFSLREVNTSTVLLAHDGEAKCGEGKCGGVKAGSESKCGIKKLKKFFKRNKSTKKAKSTEAKCGEGKCGQDKTGTEAKCGSEKKN